VGGFYYGYNTAQHEFGWRVAESLWSAGYAIPALLRLSQLTDNETYRDSALLAANWLTRMSYPDQTLIPLQALAITKYPLSSWWGLYPQYYQPDMTQVAKAGILSFVDQGRRNQSSIENKHPTWFEKAFSVDFNIIDYEMASRGPSYMKMVWSWWPNVGFEPRYGGDIAFGAFATDGYLTFNATLNPLNQILAQIEELTGNNTGILTENATAMYDQARNLAAAASQSFASGWYLLARAQARSAIQRAQVALNYVQLMTPLKQTNQIFLITIVVVVMVLLTSNIYWHRRAGHKIIRRRKPQTKTL
jgi:hypothetical protein